MSEENKQVNKVETVKQSVSEKPKLAPLKNNKEAVPGETREDIMLPVMSRMRKRLAVLDELIKAKTVKYPRGSSHQHVTTAPKMFIKELSPQMTNSNFGTITYGVYKMGADGNKHVSEYWETADDGKRRLVSANPVIEKTVVETYEFRKPGVIENFYEGDF